MYGYIYKRENKLNNKIYIGQHKYNKPEIDKRYRGSGSYFKNALQKYGEENFTYELLAFAGSSKELDKLECFYINQLNTISPNGYNLREGGNGKVVSEESRKLISLKAKERFANIEYKRQFRERWQTWLINHPDYRLKLRAARTGAGNPMYRKAQSEHQKSSVRMALKGKPKSKETRNKISQALKGKKSWSKGKKGDPRLSGVGSYWITDKKINKKWYDKYGDIPEGFVRGRSNIKTYEKDTKHWYTNGKNNILSDKCPDGYHLGRYI